MGKLGEAKLGSTQLATGGDIEVSSEIDEAVRERAEAVMKSIFPTHEGTEWDKILDIILIETKREYEVIEDIVSGRFIDDADGEQLDMIASLWQTERRSGERDSHFRSRIKTQFTRHTSRATPNEILQASSTILRTDKQRVLFDENFDIEPARFDLYIEEIVFQNSGVTVEEFETLLRDVKPAGVRAFATIGEQFTHRSVTDFNDGINDTAKAYNDYDESQISGYDTSAPTNDEPATLDGSETKLDTGGEYADEITQQYT